MTPHRAARPFPTPVPTIRLIQSFCGALVSKSATKQK